MHTASSRSPRPARAISHTAFSVAFTILSACGSVHPASGDDVAGDGIGVLQARLTAPADGCLSITARSSLRDSSGQFQISAAVDTQVVLDGLPLAAIEISGAFYATASCTGQPLYVAAPVSVELSPQQPVGHVTLAFLANGSIAIDGTFEGQSRAILVDDFSEPLDPTRWDTSFTAGASVFLDPDAGTLRLETVPNTACGSAEVNSVPQAEITTGRTLVLEAVVAAYHDQAIYGDHQPRGLRAGTDASNAIEFVSAVPVPTTILCRSARDGASTETTVDIGRSISDMNTYRIEASSSAVRFFVNGQLVCQHTTDIPTGVPLNAFFSTSDGCFGNVPQVIDRVELDIQ